MHALVDGLLDYVRAGSQREPREELCIQEILEEVLAGLSRSPEVHIELSEELMELTGVVYPRSDLHQVFANLIDNAFSHMGRAGRVRVSGRGTFEGYEFRVADDGVGIPVEHQPQVFRLFEKIPASAPTASVGAGLAIAKKIVERNGGEIRLEPVARGTTIVFSVPRGEPVLPPALEKARLERCI
jgi:chemotaxis family two-component system sensor kinase Cph1